MARVLIIFNPVAARTDARVLRTVTDVLVRAGWEVDVVGTTRHGHAAELAREGATDGVDVIGVYGGDGTIMQAVAGIVHTELPVAIIPGGTGNQLARNLRIPTAPARAAQAVIRGRMRRVDLGEWRGGTATAYFAVACGAGLDAEVMNATTRAMKKRWKTVAYTWQAVRLSRAPRPAWFRITVDGVVTEVEATTVMVANCAKLFPPYMPIRPTVSLDDGLLDVVALRAETLTESMRVLYSLMRGRDDPGRIRHIPGKEIHVEAEPQVGSQHDGENGGVTPFSARVLPGALRLLVAGDA